LDKKAQKSQKKHRPQLRMVFAPDGSR